ncbi:MAG: hypothetical protein QOE36_1925 [Gaiellaceae bacterium]|jgi:hypothetical protein|nr:hypothetical protein [Gaiellaceae bacterium]
MKKQSLIIAVAAALALCFAGSALADANTAPTRPTHMSLPPKALLAGLPPLQHHAKGARHLATTYSFSLRTPWSAQCQYAFLGSTNYKLFSITPPVVYAKDASAQYVYWRSQLWNTATSQTVWTGAWNSGIAYSNYPAQFPSKQSVQVTGQLAFSTFAVEDDVLWYSPTYGWHSAAISAQVMLVGGNSGYTTLQYVC